MGKLQRWLFILSIFCLSVSLVGCGENKTQQIKKELVYASTKDIRDINPHLYGGEIAAQAMVFEPLVYDSKDGIKPGLAETWEISEDGLVYTFHIRQGVKFTDGESLNAEAVKKNFDVVIANKARHAWLDMINQIDHGEVVDEYTYKLVLKNPYYPTLQELALSRPFRIISPKCFKEGETKNGVTGYAGTGPYILTEHKEKQYAIFTANQSYWGEKPKIETIKWRVMPDHQTILLALKKGEIDLLFGADGDMIDLDSFAALKKEGKYEAAMSEPIASRAILINAHQPITSDRNVREAFQYIVNKEAIADGILNGTETVANTLLSSTVPYCNVPLEKRVYDLEKAKRILDRIGWKVGEDGYRYKDGKKMTVTIYYNSNNAQEQTISEYLQSDMKAAGVDLQIVGEEKQAFLDRQKAGDFDLQYSLSWGAPYDPQSYLSSWRIPAHGDYQAQKGIEKKPWLDDKIGKVLAEGDKEKRQMMYQEILTYIHEECVYLPLTYSRTKAVYSPGLKGVGFNLSQYEIPFEKMYFE
ncbi:nickel ABC transporter substrate-binding protein [Anaerosinus massiliensis]|uniref:nickel ABC transporter substrate-binding protein n=1 Tax=Massilibacillus massiliensis TaxID=1806837 RepID=UPI000A4C51D6|nr:nickel ABC transporter substrate-binding protein [Massilibacillus massiliensis]